MCVCLYIITSPIIPQFFTTKFKTKWRESDLMLFSNSRATVLTICQRSGVRFQLPFLIAGGI